MITNLRDKLNKISASPPKPQRKKHDISDAIGGSVVHYGNGGFILKCSSYKIGMEYGDFCIENVEQIYPELGELLFLDTETTGLGSVSCPFLIGIAYYNDDELCLEQIFMRDVDDEESALLYLIDKYSDKNVVTFNGKTFDIPLVRGRCTINAIRSDKFASEQIDLLHLSRRIWKKRLPSCRLGTIEEEILNFQREHDIAGSEVPELYKIYLETGRADDIIKIIEHNESDVVSMTVLLSKLLRVDKDPVSELDNIMDVMHLGEFYYNRKEYDRAKECLEAVIHTKTDPLTLYSAMKYLSLIHKRNGEWDKSLYYWDRMSKVNIGAVFPFEELAKYYEHKASDLEKALKYAENAKLISMKFNNKEKIRDIDLRISRLNNKIVVRDSKNGNKGENKCV